MKPVRYFLSIAVLSATLTTYAGTPQESAIVTTPPPSPDGWWFRASPYLWLTAIDGHVSIGRLTAPVDISMHDTLKSFDMGFMGEFEAGYGRWSLCTDVLYAKTSEDIGGGGALFKSFRYEQKQWLITPVIAYRAVEGSHFNLDLFGGVQIMSLRSDLTGRFVSGGQVEAGRDLTIVDPVIGLRGQVGLGDAFFLDYRGQVGGFGADSKFTWEAYTGLGYHLSRYADISLGYRAVGIDYDKDAFSLNTTTHGPILGFELRF